MSLDPKPPPPSHARLFGIDLKHSYYANGLCSDFAVIATDDTAKLLRNHRCVVKPKANGIEIYVETDTNHKPKIAFSPKVTLSFELHLKNPEFELFTDPSPLKGESDWQITYAKPTGRYFGKLDIYRDFNKMEGKSIEFFFSAKKAFWVYYLIANPADGEEFSPQIQQPDEKISWELSNGSDPIFEHLKVQYHGMTVLRFISKERIPCRESGLRHIRLLLREKAIIDNLPNPSWRNYFQLKNATANFHVVKYLPTH